MSYIPTPYTYNRPLLGGLDRELEGNVLACEVAVNGRESVELVLELVLVLGVKVDTDELRAVRSDTGTLADDLGRVDEVLEHLLVDGGKGARAGTLLAELGVRVALLLREDTALGEEDNVLVGKLLLELTSKANVEWVDVD